MPAMLDLKVKVININYDKSAEVLNKSKTLKEYSYFIYQVKAYKNKKFTLEESINKAMKDCINQGILKEFLEENGSEVINMLFTEFNLEDAKEVWQDEAERRGQKKGEKKERKELK